MPFGVEVEVPLQVLTTPVDGFGLDPASWDPDEPLPDQLALRWLAGQPFEAWSLTLLSRIDPVRLPATDLPVYLAMNQKAEAFLAARRYRATAALAGASDQGKRFDEVDTAAH